MLRQVAIAIGAALLAAAFVVVEWRMDYPWKTGVLFLVAAVPAALLLGAGLRERPLADRPRTGTSALLLGGLILFAVADVRLLQLLGRDELYEAPRTLTAFFALLAAVALLVAWRSRSAACLFFGALAVAGTATAAVWWIFDTEDLAAYRVVLLVLAVGFAAAAWAMRAGGRHRDVLANAAGLSILAIAFLGGGLFLGIAEGLPDAWDVVVLVGALAMVGYAAVTRAPGPGVIAVLLLVAFVSLVAIDLRVDVEDEGLVGDPSLKGWPLILAIGGVVALAYGLTRRADEDPVDAPREVRP